MKDSKQSRVALPDKINSELVPVTRSGALPAVPLPVEGAMSPQDVVNQIQMVQQVMAAAMKEGEHFGVIPGTGKWNPQTRKEEGKKSLLKAGAEKLCLLFRLAPEYTVETIELAGGHREVRVACRLIQIGTGRFFGSGLGSCTTLESKYRYRNDYIMEEDGKTNKPVPSAYWGSRDFELLGGLQFRAHKKDGKWIIVRRVEITDPADVYNTILKMAKKRAYVDATISATAASDIFTQDMEDLEEPEYETKASGYVNDVGNNRRQKEAEVSEKIAGVVTEAYDKPAKTKDGTLTGETLFGAKIGGKGVWTKDPEIGQELLDAYNLPIVAYVVNSGKSLRLLEIEIPDNPHAELEEPGEADWPEKATPKPSTDNESDVPFHTRIYRDVPMFRGRRRETML